MFTRFPQCRLSAAAVAAALCVLGGPAAAAPVSFGNITLDATYSLGGGPTQDGMSEPGSTYTSPTGADFYLSKSAGGDNVFFHTYGFTGSPTYFGARASGGGVFDAYTRSTFSGTFVAGQTTPVFNFFVEGGELAINGTGTGTAGLKLEVRVNGQAVARSETTLTLNGSTATCAENDLGVLASYMGCGAPDSLSVSAGGQTFDALLNGINAGDSFTLDYDIIATVSGNLTAGTQLVTVCDPYGGYGGYGGLPLENGGGPLLVDTLSVQPGGNSCTVVEVPVAGFGIARSGDPFNFGAPNADPSIPGALAVQGAVPATDNTVPEPGSLALVGAAVLAAAAGQRRRRRDGST